MNEDDVCKLLRILINNPDWITLVNEENFKQEVRMAEGKSPREPKSHHHFMVDCLMEEIIKYPRKFNDRTIDFIRNLSAQFFNDPNLELTNAQANWLEDIWTK